VASSESAGSEARSYWIVAVTGRSRVKFDEMVRLDLRYATTWTPWLDLMILLRTPAAVIKGSGAYETSTRLWQISIIRLNALQPDTTLKTDIRSPAN